MFDSTSITDAIASAINFGNAVANSAADLSGTSSAAPPPTPAPPQFQAAHPVGTPVLLWVALGVAAVLLLK